MCILWTIYAIVGGNAMRQKLNFKHSDSALRKTIQKYYAYDIASMYTFLEEHEKQILLKLIQMSKLIEVFVELDEEEQKEIFEKLSNEQQKRLLRLLETDELKAFISRYETHEERHRLVLMLPKVKQRTVELLLTYEEDEAASIMMTEFFTIPIDLTIKEATHMIITKSKENDYIDTVFVQNEQKKCVGLIDLDALIVARPNQKLSSIMTDDFPFVYPTDAIEEAIQYVLDYDRNVLPVINEENQIVGIITADDIFDEIIEDYEEDYEAFSQITDHHQMLSATSRAKQRLPWLFLGVALNLLTITILSLFSNTLEQLTVLILFQPMILGMAGNIGTQSLAVTILGIHQSEYHEKYKAKRHIKKEMLVGIINSLMLSIIAFIFVYVYLTIFKINDQLPYEVALTVFFALFSAMFISSVMGSSVPLILNHFKIDPALASGPMMTTINDIVSLVIYFGIATLIFSSLFV